MKNLFLTLSTLLLSSLMMVAFATAPSFTVQIRDSGGGHLSDENTAVLKYYDSGWKTATYVSDGNFAINTPESNLTIKMYYAGGSQQASNVPTNTTYTFNTTEVTVSLESSLNAPLSDGMVKYYASGWKTFGTTDGTGEVTKELLPVSYSFKMYYMGASQQVSNQDVGTTPLVQFQTTLTTVSLLSSVNAPLSDGMVKYYASGWKTFGTTDGTGEVTKELLPVSYSFKMYYMGGSQQISNQNVGTNPLVQFQTTLTTVSLLSSVNAPLSDGMVKYYASGWKTFGTTDGTGEVTKELLPVSYSFKMYYMGGSQQISNQNVGTNPLVQFQTTLTTVSLLSSVNAPLSDGMVKYYASGWKTFGTTDGTGEVTKELLPVSYSFKMYYMGGSQQISNQNVGTNPLVQFQTTLVTVELKNCDDDGVDGGVVKYYASGWKSFGTTDGTGEVTKELLPVSYSFKMYLNGKSQQISNQNVGSDPTVSYTTVTVTLNYTGTIKFYASGWKTFNQPTMEMLPGTYNFKFYGTGGFDFQQSIELTGCSYGGNVFAFRTLKADGSALPNIDIRRNDYGNHYVTVGSTDANGWLFTTNMPAGSWKYRANKNYTNQYITSGPALLTFQTAKYIAHVKHTDGSDFEGIETEYNDYGSHWIDLDPQHTDANGEASIELFAGTYNFRAKKNYSVQTKSLALANPGDVGTAEFQTATYTAHVKMHDGSDFSGIETEYNDYGNHWIDLSPQYTDANGNASIELFPGDFDFRAKKNYSVQENSLEITTSGSTDVVEFQTALAVGFVRDCDLDQGVAGIQVEYNDYGSHWIDLAPQSTGVDGKASIELFPGTFDLRAKNIYTSESKSITLVNSGDVTEVEFNPTRVCFNYDKVKYNDYGSHWYTMSCGEYMFPGTYDFRFYTGGTLDLQESIAISGCSFEKAPIFVQLKNSLGNGLPNADFKYRFGYGPYTIIGTDVTGNGIWYFIDGNPGNTKVRVSYRGTSVEKQQNVQVNPMFIFNTELVTATLLESDNDDITNDGTWQYRYGYDPYSPFDPAGEELLPVNTKVRVAYKGSAVEKQQNVGSDASFEFNTVSVTATLLESDNDDITAGGTWQYRYGYDPYQPFDPAGVELLPVNTKVRVAYKGSAVEKQQNVGSDDSFEFNTVSVTATLLESDNDDITAGGTWQYRYGYDPYSTLDPNGEELLPVNTKVRVAYKGSAVEKQQNVGGDASFDFNTVLVTATLTDGGSDVTSSGTWQYRYGYDPYTAFDPTGEELLPVNTKVKVTYMSTSDEKQQNVGTAPHFSFTYDGSIYSVAQSNGSTTYAIFNSKGIENGDLGDVSGLDMTLYPNPATLVSNITYNVPKDAMVQLDVFDLNGNKVTQLHRGNQTAGKYTRNWDVSSLTPGTYVIQLRLGEVSTFKRIVVTR